MLPPEIAYFPIHQVPSFMSSLTTNGVVTTAAHQGSPYDESSLSQTFDFPFSELIVWAVLTRRHEMAKLMWQHGEFKLYFDH